MNPSEVGMAQIRQDGPSGLTNNPYDYVGRLHNAFLDLLERTARKVAESEGAQDIDANDLLASFLQENEIEPLNMRPELPWSESADAIAGIDGLLDEGTISEAQHRYLREIEGAIDTTGHDLETAPALRALSDIETRVAGDDGLDETDKALVLSTASVARHSAEYWAREAHNPSSIWFDPADPDVSSDGTTTIAKSTIGSDAKGAVEGAVVGLATGGTPAAVAGGAAAGAIKASAGKQITKGIKKIWGKIKSLF
jgi:hypothetical protein